MRDAAGRIIRKRTGALWPSVQAIGFAPWVFSARGALVHLTESVTIYWWAPHPDELGWLVLRDKPRLTATARCGQTLVKNFVLCRRPDPSALPCDRCHGREVPPERRYRNHRWWTDARRRLRCADPPVEVP